MRSTLPVSAEYQSGRCAELILANGVGVPVGIDVLGFRGILSRASLDATDPGGHSSVLSMA